ncbi:MAG: GDP-mannose 4,6-dehydratase [Acidimicrobiia bacterium]|nr:GDP-mannose 4,6-dehydratase [Acidimicrobiia bacterium]
MRALVTGSSGFAGRHLVAHLESCGDDVSGLDRADGIDITDASALGRHLESVRPEVVYHLAGWADVGGSWDDPLATFEANALGTLHLLTAARTSGVRRVLVVGSADVYGKVGETDLPLTEAQPLAPVSPYAASKVTAEYLAIQAWNGHGLETVRTRSFNHIGPGQSNRFVAAAIAERVARAEHDLRDEVEVGNVTPRRDFTDVRDVARAYRALMVDGRAGEVYHVCSGRDLAIRELADILLGMAERPMTLSIDPALQRPVDIPVLRGDPSKLRSDTSWEPQISIEDTLAELLAEARTRTESGA